MAFAIPLIPVVLGVQIASARVPDARVWGVPVREIKPFTSAALTVSLIAQFSLLAWGLRREAKRKRLIATGHVCADCMYDVSGVTGPICPECGKAITRPAPEPKPTASSTAQSDRRL